jgi:methylmalonyl-CoA epimerase
VLTRCDHIAILVKDVDEALKTYLRIFDFKKEDIIGPFDWKYTEPPEVVKIAFARVGNIYLELISPVTPGVTARTLEKRGEGVHHIAFVSDQIEKEWERHLKSGLQLVSEKPQLDDWGTTYWFIHPKSLHHVMFEIIGGPEYLEGGVGTEVYRKPPQKKRK